MKNVLELIAPIKLTRGPREDCAKTGEGCFLNVVAYLQGEEEPGTSPEGLCPITISATSYFNDILEDYQRHKLLPYIFRVMKSNTCKKEDYVDRLLLMAKFLDKFNMLIPAKVRDREGFLSRKAVLDQTILEFAKAEDASFDDHSLLLKCVNLIDITLVQEELKFEKMETPSNQEKIVKICLEYLDAILPLPKEEVVKEVLPMAEKYVNLSKKGIAKWLQKDGGVLETIAS